MLCLNIAANTSLQDIKMTVKTSVWAAHQTAGPHAQILLFLINTIWIWILNIIFSIVSSVIIASDISSFSSDTICRRIIMLQLKPPAI